MLGVLAALTESGRTETRNHRLLCTLRCSCSCPCRALPIAPPPRPDPASITQPSDARDRFNASAHARTLACDPCVHN